MDISALALKIIIILIPGIISTNIYRKLTFRANPIDNFKDGLSAIVLGVFSYVMLQFAFNLKIFLSNMCFQTQKSFVILNTFENISLTNNIPYKEVFYSSLVSIFVGFVAAFVDNKKIINRMGGCLKVSNKFGEENLYMKFLNSPDIDYIYIRDTLNKLTYFGYVESYSESENFKEIVLGNVSVYNYPECDFLYDVDKIYLCFPVNSVIFELAKDANNGTEADKTSD